MVLVHQETAGSGVPDVLADGISGSVPSEIRHDHPQARVGQQRDHVDVAVDVIGETMQQQHGVAVGMVGFVVEDVEDPSRAVLRGSSRARPVGDPAGAPGMSVLQVGQRGVLTAFDEGHCTPPLLRSGVGFLIELLETPPR